jgi:mannan endo-1,4-beta-mannosidase
VAVTEQNAPVTLHATANDITYWWVPLLENELDLDPAAPGQQTEYTTGGGTFTLLSGGGVLFTPAPDFHGRAMASYVVPDAWHRPSNSANLSVTVQPLPSAVLKLFSFESGTEGWAPASWQTNAGSVSQSGAFATDGAASLQVDTADGGWFGVVLAPSPLDLAPRTHLKYDIQTTGTGTSVNAALQLTDGWLWCQGPWGWAGAGTTATVDLDLTNLSCGVTDVAKVQAIYIWFQAGGTFYLDNVRAE